MLFFKVLYVEMYSSFLDSAIKKTEEVFFFTFFLFFVLTSFSSLRFRSDISHFLPPKNLAIMHKNEKKYITWNLSIWGKLFVDWYEISSDSYIFPSDMSLLFLPSP